MSNEDNSGEEFSPEVLNWYQFPEDKALRHAFVTNSLYFPSEAQAAKNESEALKIFLLIMGTNIAGYYAYCYGQYPSGKVIRDRLQATWSPLKRWTVKGLPFLGFAVGLLYFRGFTREHNQTAVYWDQVKKDRELATQKRFAKQ